MQHAGAFKVGTRPYRKTIVSFHHKIIFHFLVLFCFILTHILEQLGCLKSVELT